jgi:hypothetical protein
LNNNRIGSDRASSIRVRRLGDDDDGPSRTIAQLRGGVTLYTDSRFRGQAESFTIDDSDLTDNDVGNDRVSSIRVPAGYRVTLYEHEGFRGRSETFTTDDPDLTDNRIGDNRVSSIRVERLR